MCASGTLRIYLNFGCKPKYNFGDSQNITLTKSKYNLHCKLNCEAMIAKREKTVGKRRFFVIILFSVYQNFTSSGSRFTYRVKPSKPISFIAAAILS